ncbi:MAG: hypothetical protein GX638_07255 [Crenarchaeota archaeon]|nr:hypothetical protein [Thermoproteota archaeon]
MNNQEKTLIFMYIYNQRVHMERELSERQARLRCRSISETECIEYALLHERYNTFREVTGHIMALLNMDEKKPVNTCIICGREISKDLQVCSRCYKRYKRV